MAEWSQLSFSSPEILVLAEGCRFESCRWLLFLYLYSVYMNKKFSHPSSLSYVVEEVVVKVVAVIGAVVTEVVTVLPEVTDGVEMKGLTPPFWVKSRIAGAAHF